jgi:hypothetical protein
MLPRAQGHFVADKQRGLYCDVSASVVHSGSGLDASIDLSPMLGRQLVAGNIVGWPRICRHPRADLLALTPFGGHTVRRPGPV